MNWEKFATTRNVMFATCFIPGTAFLLVIALKFPLLRHQFEGMEFLGYKTKLSLILVLSFAAGFPIQGIFVAFRHAVNQRKDKRDEKEIDEKLEIAKPWNCRTWRALAQQMLGLDNPPYANEAEVEDYWKKLYKRLDHFGAVEWEPRNYRSIRFMAAAIFSASSILAVGTLIPPIYYEPQSSLRWLSLGFSVMWAIVLLVYVLKVPAGRKTEEANPGRAQDLFMIRLLLTRSISSLDTK